MSTFKMTAETAMNIIAKKQQADTPKNYKVTHRVSDQPQYWEQTGEPYYIVNTDLTTLYLHAQSVDLFKEGKFQEATNKGLTFRASPELAEKLRNCLSANATVDYVTNKDGEEILLIVKMSGIESVKGRKVDMSAFTIEEIVQPEAKVQESVVA